MTPDLLPRARMDLLDWFQLLITLTLTLASAFDTCNFGFSNEVT